MIRMVAQAANGDPIAFKAFMEMSRSEFLAVVYGRLANGKKQN